MQMPYFLADAMLTHIAFVRACPQNKGTGSLHLAVEKYSAHRTLNVCVFFVPLELEGVIIQFGCDESSISVDDHIWAR